MADFSPYGYSQGMQAAASSISATNTGINARNRLRFDREQASADRAQANRDAAKKALDDLLATRDKLAENSLSVFNEITTAAANAEKTGRLTDDQRAQFRNAAQGALISTITTLQQDAALALQSGASLDDPFIREIQSRMQALSQTAPSFDARVTAARAEFESPQVLGKRTAQERVAEIRELAAELGMDSDDVADRVLGGTDQPAPTELEKLERMLKLLDAEQVPDDDPRRLRVLGRLASVTTPSIADIISPLIQKKARGIALTEEEQSALDIAQRLSFTEVLMRGALGFGGGGGAPNYSMDEDGNLVPTP